MEFRHKQTKDYTFLSTATAQRTMPTVLGTAIEEIHAILHTPKFFKSDH